MTACVRLFGHDPAKCKSWRGCAHSLAIDLAIAGEPSYAEEWSESYERAYAEMYQRSPHPERLAHPNAFVSPTRRRAIRGQPAIPQPIRIPIGAMVAIGQHGATLGRSGDPKVVGVATHFGVGSREVQVLQRGLFQFSEDDIASLKTWRTTLDYRIAVDRDGVPCDADNIAELSAILARSPDVELAERMMLLWGARFDELRGKRPAK